MASDELLSAALRIMAGHIDAKAPDAGDEMLLRNEVAGQPQAKFEIHVLASHIIDRELAAAKPH